MGLEEKISRSLNVVIELQANKSRTREVITTAKIHNSTAALSDTIWNWSGRAHLLYHYCSKMVLVLFNNYVGLNYIYSPAFRSTKFLFSHQLKKTNGGSLCFAYIYGCFLSGDDTYLCHYTLKLSPFYWSLVYRVLC